MWSSGDDSSVGGPSKLSSASASKLDFVKKQLAERMELGYAAVHAANKQADEVQQNLRMAEMMKARRAYMAAQGAALHTANASPAPWARTHCVRLSRSRCGR